MVRDMAEVSIVVPVYKVEKYLTECVESLCAQTFRDLDIILVDDGSPDRCPEICDELARKDPRIRVVHQKNGGLSSARNAGIREALRLGCEYVSFVDSDDRLQPDMIEIMRNACVSSGAPLAACGQYWLTETSMEPLDSTRCDGSIEVRSSRDMIYKAWTSRYEGLLYTLAICKLFNLRFFGEDLHFEEGIIHEDEQLASHLYLRDFQVAVVNQPIYDYRMNPNSITHVAFAQKNCVILRIMEERIRAFKQKGYQEPIWHTAVIFVECYIEYYQKAVRVGHPEWLDSYRPFLPDMIRLANHCSTPKTRLRFLIFKLAPNYYIHHILKG